MISRDLAVEKLCHRWKSPFPEMAIRAAIADSFPDLVRARPPIEIRRLAALRKVISISERSLDCDGMISRTDSGAYIIEVNKDHPKTRQRFTIAHEIGHTFFFELDDSVQRRYRIRDSGLENLARSSREEYLCNYAAAELLMPYHQFGSLIRQTGPTSNSLRKLGGSFEVSLQAAARRATQLLSLTLVTALWEYEASTSSYVTRWLVGTASRDRSGKQTLRVKKNDPAFEILHSHDQFRGRLWISLGGPLDDYFVDTTAFLSEAKRKVLTVFLLEPNPSLLLKKREMPLRKEEQLLLF